MFEKRTVIYKKKDKETWTKIKSALKDGGLTGFKASHYLQDSVMAGGCGAKLDPRDFGLRGKTRPTRLRQQGQNRSRGLCHQSEGE